ncbi:hypothetical protein [uncultured Serinicoccus sp.]|uniref:hypothetical protein n=1 Tax=uncultured Serinicoccus sp. TaxID=735514 RepID=UPI0026211EB6|nr:hypothetical protein [uncultured Serinicoccus sp.]
METVGGFVGGDPAQMGAGARALHRTGGRVEEIGRGLAQLPASGTGYADLSTAVRRLGSAVGTAVEDTGTQTTIAAALADAAAQDIDTAGGG